MTLQVVVLQKILMELD